MLRTPIGWVVVVVIGAAVILGPAAFRTTIGGARNRAAEIVEDAKSFEQQLSEARYALQGMNGEIDRTARDVAKAEFDANAAKRRLAALEREKVENDAILRRADELLSEGRDNYEIGARRHSRRELETDAVRHVEAGKQLQADIAEGHKEVQETDAGVAEGKKLLGELERERQTRADEIERLNMTYQNARRRGDIAELRRAFRFTVSNTNSELARKLEMLRQRVWAANRRAESLSADVRGGIIDWTSSAAAEDARSAIKSYFDGESADAGR